MSPFAPHTNSRVDPSWWPLWEAWEFTNGDVWVGSASRKVPHQADTFAMPDFGDCTKGTITIKGEVKAIIGFVLPKDMAPRNKPPAEDLPYTQQEPLAWAGAHYGAAHTLTADWDCCPKGVVTRATIVTTNP